MAQAIPPAPEHGRKLAEFTGAFADVRETFHALQNQDDSGRCA